MTSHGTRGKTVRGSLAAASPAASRTVSPAMTGQPGAENDTTVAAARMPIFVAGPSRWSAEVPGTARNTRPPRRGRADGAAAAGLPWRGTGQDCRAAGHLDRPGAREAHVLKVVRDDDEREAVGAAHVPEELKQPAPALPVEARERLVQDQHARP